MNGVSNGGEVPGTPKRRGRFEVQYRSTTMDTWVRWSSHRKREKAEESLRRLQSFYGPTGSFLLRLVDLG